MAAEASYYDWSPLQAVAPSDGRIRMFRREIALPIDGRYLAQSKFSNGGRPWFHSHGEWQGLRIERGRAVERNIPHYNFC